MINVGHNSGSQGGQDLASFIGTMNYKQTWHKHPWVKGIQVCPNERPGPSQKGDNWEMVEIN